MSPIMFFPVGRSVIEGTRNLTLRQSFWGTVGFIVKSAEFTH